MAKNPEETPITIIQGDTFQMCFDVKTKKNGVVSNLELDGYEALLVIRKTASPTSKHIYTGSTDAGGGISIDTTVDPHRVNVEIPDKETAAFNFDEAYYSIKVYKNSPRYVLTALKGPVYFKLNPAIVAE